VLAVTFASGLRLIYKPKDVHLEQAYFALLGWFEERGAPLSFARLRVIDGDGYGWSEFAETLPCDDADAAGRYYRRAGMLLGLLYGLAGNDCHYDNIVAHGEHPVLVDMETFMHPQPQAFEDDAAAEMLGARAVATEVFRASVLSTGLLPRWMVNKEGRTHDASGLGGVGEQESFDPMPRWRHVNTDAMTVTHELAYFRPTQNVPVLDGEPLSPNDFVEELVDGLRTMYQLLLDHREAMLAPAGPLEAFAHQPVRYLLRDTRTYAMVIDRALQRPFLRDGAAFSIELDVLSRALATTSEPSLFWPLRIDEQAAMERLDIPFFATTADSADLPLTGGRSVERAFTRSGFDLAAERLRLLSAEDLERQIAYTRASFYSRTASSLGETRSSERAPGSEAVATAPLTRDELVAGAEAIARELHEHAIRSPDGGSSWIGVAFLPQSDRYQLEPTGFDLYSGNPGIALFLAALAKVTGSAETRDDARSAMLQVTQMVRAHPERLAKGLGIGGAAGTGSLVYSLVRTAELLGDAETVVDAERAAALITPNLIAADKGLDVLSGSAGALLGLLALYDVTGDRKVLDRAVLCGRRLVATQVTEGPERGCWPTLSQTGITGFSHGAAGIAYSLLRLVTLADDPAFLAAAEAAIAYERRVFAPDEGNWPDLRKEVLAMTDGRPSFMTQWCHGATGIGLARLAGLAALDTPDVREDIDLAVVATQRFGVQSVDHICCGSMGRAELLLSAGRDLGRPQLVEEAGRFAATVVRRAQASDGYKVMGRLPRGVGCPSFYQGTAGIGYHLLRQAHPGLVPSVLVWA
jgi:type 2 lantibiotic biosynthesis protein LanM